jgi:hypothetical protein
MTIYRSQIAVLIRPFVPDTNSVFLEVFDIGVASEKPKQFMDNGLEVEFLGGEEGETFFQIKTHLMSKNRNGASASTVMLFCALL